MPPLIVWGVGLLGGAAISRWAINEAKRINRELDEARAARAQSAPVKVLRRDPQTGVYRAQ